MLQAPPAPLRVANPSGLVRFRSECLSGFDRIQCPLCVGISVRFRSDCAAFCSQRLRPASCLPRRPDCRRASHQRDLQSPLSRRVLRPGHIGFGTREFASTQLHLVATRSEFRRHRWNSRSRGTASCDRSSLTNQLGNERAVPRQSRACLAALSLNRPSVSRTQPIHHRRCLRRSTRKRRESRGVGVTVRRSGSTDAKRPAVMC